MLGLADFGTIYFPFPVFLDLVKNFYSYLGNRSLAAQRPSTYNPFKLFARMSKMSQRLRSKGVKGNFKGEGLLQGGVVVLDRRGGVEYIYYERTFSALPVEEIRGAMDRVLRR